MADESGSRRGLIAVIVVLVLALLVAVVLWQREEESGDLDIDLDTGDAGTVVEPAPAVVRTLPAGIRVAVA